MSLRHLVRYGSALSPASAAAKAWQYLKRRVGAWCHGHRNARRCTYPAAPGASNLAPPPVSLAAIGGAIGTAGSILDRLADNYMAHRFDLLGSGWVNVRQGMNCQGFEGHLYASAALPDAEAGIVQRLSPGNRERAAAIRGAISPGYIPIDWQLDFRSGYRWREDQWSAGIPYGHQPGIDVKVPWELARLQHLPGLALAAKLGGSKTRTARRRECRDQMLDFISTNPPGYGVNWRCTMDVAIRAANMVMTQWLLKATANTPADPDETTFVEIFERELNASLVAHGRHIMANLERAADFRGNHYLADVCGLAFVAAGLAPSEESDGWWRFAVGEINAETVVQFGEDGGNCEGSTSYHRLSAEMIAYAVALILGRDGAAALRGDIGTRLWRMAHFSQDTTKPDGRVVQVGDNDSGRFFRFGPGDFDDDLSEDHLDHGALHAIVASLFGAGETFFPDTRERFAIETAVVSALAEGRRLDAINTPLPDRIIAGPVPTAGVPLGPEVEIVLPETAVLSGLTAIAYPDFGLFIWKSPRFFMSVRCGPIGQNGRGGHAHNDQLAIELQVDGTDWLADPGSYVYTAAPAIRDTYRSVMAHAAPRRGRREPAALNLGMFRLEDRTRSACLSFDIQGFLGCHHGFGEATYRALRVESTRILIRDAIGGPADWNRDWTTVRLTSAAETRRHFDIGVPFSSGYGLRTPS